MEKVLSVVGAASDDSEPYLCHNFCECGAIRAEDGFAEINDFLRENPNDVVLIILQDDRSRPLTPSRCCRRATSPTAPTRGSRVRPCRPSAR